MMLAERIIVPQRFGGYRGHRESVLDGVPLVRTLQLVGGVNGPALWRTFQPCAALQQEGWPAIWEFVGDRTNAERAQLGLPPVPELHVKKVLAFATSGQVDAVILPRMGWPAKETARMQGFLRTLKAAGNVLIYEADDDVFSPWISRQQHAGILAHRSLTQLEEERLVRIDCLRSCDGATVSTQRLASVVRQYVPDDFPIEVVPNLIDWAWWTRIKVNAQRWVPPVTIGWAGGGRPDDDLSLLADAWGQIAHENKDVRFVLQGCRSGPDGKPSLKATPWMAPIAEAVPADRLVLLPFFTLMEYPLGMLNIDILCCPLVDRPFNRNKSTIKVLEGAAAGAAVVASPAVYKGVIDPLLNGFLATTTQEWVDALRAYLSSPELRAEMASRLARKVYERHTLQREVYRWPMAWQNIVSQVRGARVRRVV